MRHIRNRLFPLLVFLAIVNVVVWLTVLRADVVVVIHVEKSGGTTTTTTIPGWTNCIVRYDFETQADCDNGYYEDTGFYADAHGTQAVANARPAWTTNALTFDSSDDSVIVRGTNRLHGATALTMSCWMDIVDREETALICHRGTQLYGLIYSNTREVYFYVTASWAAFSSGDLAIETEGWQHWVGTWTSGEGPKLYLNGSLVTQAAGTVTHTISLNDNTYLGWDDVFGSGRNFGGELDSVNIYDRALTATEVTNLFDLGRAP